LDEGGVSEALVDEVSNSEDFIWIAPA